MQVSWKTFSTYSCTLGAAIRSGSEPPMSRVTILQTLSTEFNTGLKKEQFLKRKITWLCRGFLNFMIMEPNSSKYPKYEGQSTNILWR